MENKDIRCVVISDFSMQGSGYLNIAAPLCNGLADCGFQIKVFGIGYNGEQHPYNFSIIPTRNIQEISAMLGNFQLLWKPDVVIVALDIPYQQMVFDVSNKIGIPQIGITAIESGPVCFTWALILQRINKIFTISQLGADECIKKGVEAEHLYVGMDTKSWRKAIGEEKEKIRESLGIGKDEFVILTVADNQERKNLSKAFEIVSKFKKMTKAQIRYILVTREHSKVGWKLRDLAVDFEINSNLMILERGMSFKQLWGIYVMSDVFLLSSKAEGLCNLPGSKIWTLDGLKNIENIRIGEKIITESGKLREVSELFTREIKEKINEITIGFGLEKLKLTDNHLVLGAKKFVRKMINNEFIKKENIKIEWINSQNISKLDYVFYPELPTHDIEYICTPENLSVGTDFIVNGNEIAPVGKNQTRMSYLHPTGKRLPLELETSENLMRLLGWYISEGCDTKQGLSFSLHSDEIEYKNEINFLLTNLFNEKMIDRVRERHRYDGRISHKLLGNLFSSLCGAGAHNKKIPNWALYLPENKLWPMVESMFRGDGCIDYNAGTLRYSTVSKLLATQLQFVLLRLGIVSSVRGSKNRCEYIVTVRRPEIYKVPFVSGIKQVNKTQRQFIKVDGGWLFPVRDNKKVYYNGTVYNLEVPEEHSYLMAGGIVHNCMPVLEAMSCGIPVIATNTGALTELLNEDRGFPIDYDYVMIDPWGNSNRYMIDADKATIAMNYVYKNRDYVEKVQIKNASKYVKSRTWKKPVEQVEKAIMEIVNVKEESKTNNPA